jgi:hypothetical protein
VIAEIVAAAALLPPVPGAYNPAVTPATINTTICVSGYSTRIRPPLSYTAPLKRRLRQRYGISGPAQLDHMVSLALGGSPRSLKNLWVQPEPQAKRDDVLESRWHRLVCAGTWGLRYAQRVEIRFKKSHG